RPRHLPSFPTRRSSDLGLSAQARAEAVGRVIDEAASAGFTAFGTYRSSEAELAVASSTGIRSYASFTTAYFKALVEGPGGTGFRSEEHTSELQSRGHLV